MSAKVHILRCALVWHSLLPWTFPESNGYCWYWWNIGSLQRDMETCAIMRKKNSYFSCFFIFRKFGVLGKGKETWSRKLPLLLFSCPICWDWDDCLHRIGLLRSTQSIPKGDDIYLPDHKLACQAAEFFWRLLFHSGDFSWQKVTMML